MKKNLISGLVIVLGVILVVTLFSSNAAAPVAKDNATTTPVSNTSTSVKSTTKTASTAPIAGMKTSLGGIFNEQGNYQCDYESVTQTSRTSNVIYLSNGKMRGEFRTSQAGMATANIVVYDGNYLYVWGEGKSTGTVTQPKTLADLPGIIPEDVSSGRILGSSSNNISWNCHAWSRVASFLEKPSYVTFK